jgi:hypothetical protein
MSEPPPHVEDAYQELWHAACQLLQQNMGLTSAGDFCKVSAKSEMGWHNSGAQTVFVDRRIT